MVCQSAWTYGRCTGGFTEVAPCGMPKAVKFGSGSQSATACHVAPPSIDRTAQRLPAWMTLLLFAGSTAMARLYQAWACAMFMVLQSLDCTVGLVTFVSVSLARNVNVTPPSVVLNVAAWREDASFAFPA